MGKPDPAAAVVEPGRKCALNPTVVHEAHLRLVDQIHIPCQNHTPLCAVVANLKRHIFNHAKCEPALTLSSRNAAELDDAASMVGICTVITVKRSWRTVKPMLRHELLQRLPEAEEPI